MPELDPMNPEMGPETNPEPVVGAQPGTVDQEGAMAKADLYKLANYSYKLFKKIDDSTQLESWVQAKITKAADYIASVYHYLEYEMEFSEYGAKLENSEVYSESQKAILKNKLMEAKEKIKALKVTQASKIAEGSIFGGHEETCHECGGTGVIQMPERQVPEAVKEKVKAYNRKAKAMHAASKRIDKNKNGIPDDEEMEEGFESGAKPGDTFKTAKGVATKTKTGVVHKNTSFSDEEHGEANTTHAKSRSASDKKSDAPKQKKSKSGTWGMEGGEKFDNRKKEESVDETYGQGVYAEGKKSKKADKDYDGDGKIESGKDEYLGSKIKAAKKAGKMDEGSTGDYSAKKAAAGKDIGKPGKNFAKIAKKAGGGEKGEKIAGAVLKNLRKESAEPKSYVQKAIAEAKKKANGKKPDFLDMDKDGNKEEPMKKAIEDKKVVKESADLDRMKEFLTRLNG